LALSKGIEKKAAKNPATALALKIIKINKKSYINLVLSKL
jgi:hypothetical protein